MKYTQEEKRQIIKDVEELTSSFSQNKKKERKRMNIFGACEQLWVSHNTYFWWLKSEPEMAEYAKELQDIKIYMANHEAEAVLIDAINDNYTLTHGEKVRVAQNTLKNTSKRHNVAAAQIAEVEHHKIQKGSEIIWELKNLLQNKLLNNGEKNDADN